MSALALAVHAFGAVCSGGFAVLYVRKAWHNQTTNSGPTLRMMVIAAVCAGVCAGIAASALGVAS